VKGAFTDARQSRHGLFVKASGGTLFLDEIGEMPAGMQTKLLRALQERTVRPVGGDTEVPFDARIVTATNRDLEDEVLAKRFREDLFYRINVVNIALPPLRERELDVLVLAKHILVSCQPNERRVVGLTRAAIDAMLRYSWPGNVRELQNCLERAIALTAFDHVGVEDLPEAIGQAKPEATALDVGQLITVDELEKQYIAKVLAAVGDNKTLAAKVLGFDRRTLYRKLERTARACPVEGNPALTRESGTFSVSAQPPPPPVSTSALSHQ
jgi:two-component system response regulator HydG